VIPGLMRRAHERKMAGESGMTMWGTGKPRREFLHVDDCADGVVEIMKRYSGYEHLNLGWGEDVAIAELGRLVMEAVGLEGGLDFDTSMPDGAPRKLADTSKLRSLGWKPQIDLKTGLAKTYEWFLANAA